VAAEVKIGGAKSGTNPSNSKDSQCKRATTPSNFISRSGTHFLASRALAPQKIPSRIVS
jgi:hypothetical protein